MSKPTCEHCVYWLRKDDDIQGECKRYPPDTAVIGDATIVYHPPLVAIDNFCGEFKTLSGSDYIAALRSEE